MHPSNFSDLNSYSAEISLQNKLNFKLCIVNEKATRRSLMQNFLPEIFQNDKF